MQRPTQDEIQRVAAYWQWVEDMACEHPEYTLSNEPGYGVMTCSRCQRPLIVMSDVQLEARTAMKEEVKSD